MSTSTPAEPASHPLDRFAVEGKSAVITGASGALGAGIAEPHVNLLLVASGFNQAGRPMTHHDPIYNVNDVVHYCVANMPGAVPGASPYALTNVTLGYGLMLADNGFEKAVSESLPLKRGVNAYEGAIRHRAVADAFRMEHRAL